MMKQKTTAKIEHQVRKYERARIIQNAHLSATGNKFFNGAPPPEALYARRAMINAFFRFKSICPEDKVDEYVQSGRIDEKIRIVPEADAAVVIPVLVPKRDTYGVIGRVYTCKNKSKIGEHGHSEEIKMGRKDEWVRWITDFIRDREKPIVIIYPNVRIIPDARKIFKFELPDLGMGTVEAEIVKWFVKEGDRIRVDQPVVEVMTDSFTAVIPNPIQKAAIIKRRFGNEGDVVQVHSVLFEVYY